MPFSCGSFNAQDNSSFGQWMCESSAGERRATASKALVVSAKAYLSRENHEHASDGWGRRIAHLICFQHSWSRGKTLLQSVLLSQ